MRRNRGGGQVNKGVEEWVNETIKKYTYSFTHTFTFI
jgi:hypothetical protein